MNNELIPLQMQGIATYEDFRLKMEGFLLGLNKEPKKTKKDQNKGITYIAISEIEVQLDRLFMGQWQTKNLNLIVVGNEIVATIELGVLNPISGQWLWRSGTGSAMIRQNKGAKITDIDSKIKNAAEMDAPHAKASAIKNAAKSLGNLFGRNIARKTEDVSEYDAPFTNAINRLKAQKDEKNPS